VAEKGCAKVIRFMGLLLVGKNILKGLVIGCVITLKVTRSYCRSFLKRIVAGRVKPLDQKRGLVINVVAIVPYLIPRGELLGTRK
jgi:hypothetical protein